MAALRNTIRWFQSEQYDAPELKSPQVCSHGAGCDYKKRDRVTDDLVPACCRFVHPGEEGNGRRVFQARVWYEGEEEPKVGPTEEHGMEGVAVVRVDPAVVRLTGRAGYYERQRLRLPWAAWCARNGIAYTANQPGEAPLAPRIIPIGGGGGGGGRGRGGYRGRGGRGGYGGGRPQRDASPVPAEEEDAPASPTPAAPQEEPPRRTTKNQRQRQNRKERRVEAEACGLNGGDCCEGVSCAAVDATPAVE